MCKFTTLNHYNVQRTAGLQNIIFPQFLLQCWGRIKFCYPIPLPPNKQNTFYSFQTLLRKGLLEINCKFQEKRIKLMKLISRDLFCEEYF